jgi:hypothetical protein
MDEETFTKPKPKQAEEPEKNKIVMEGVVKRV